MVFLLEKYLHMCEKRHLEGFFTAASFVVVTNWEQPKYQQGNG